MEGAVKMSVSNIAGRGEGKRGNGSRCEGAMEASIGELNGMDGR
jgi:hypothetical protein